MAIQVSGTTVINNSKELVGITGADAATVAALGTAGLGGGIDFATSSAVSPTFSLSSNNAFIHTGVTNSSSITFSNIPTEAEWVYFFDAGADGSAFNVDAILADGVSNLTSSSALVNTRTSFLSYGNFNSGEAYRTLIETGEGTDANYVHATMLSEDGTKMALHWAAHTNAHGISVFTMSVPYDLSTATHTAYATPYYKANIQGYTILPHINQNGRGILYTGVGLSGNSSGDSYLHWQPMSTAWDLTTLGTGQTFNVGRTIYQCSMSADGKYVYYVDGSSNFYRRTLSTNYNLTTAGAETNMNPTDGSINKPSYSNSLPFWSKDGTSFAFQDGYSTRIYSCTTAWDYRTANAATYRTFNSGQSTNYWSISAGSVLMGRDNNNGHRILDLRTGNTPSFSQFSSSFLNTAAPASWNRIDFATNNGGTDIYAATTYNIAKG